MERKILENNLFGEDEFRPVPLDLRPTDPLEYYSFEQDPEKIEWGPVKPEFEDKRTDGVDMIRDPLAYYVPYHWNADLWGIYFRRRKILADFGRWTSSGKRVVPRSRRGVCFVVYMRLVYFHELCHHVLEDIAQLKGGRYPLLTNIEEEGLCEYMTFTKQNNARSPFKVPYPLHGIFSNYYQTRDRLQSRDVGDLNKWIINELYEHWNRASDKVYRPIVGRGVPEKVGLLWRCFWNSHKDWLNDVFYAPNSYTEVVDRIFSTDT